MSKVTDKIRKNIFEAVRAKDNVLSSIGQIALSAIKNEEILKGKELREEEEIGVLGRESKKLQDSIDQFQKAGRKDLVDESQTQLKYIMQFLPEQMSNSELESVVLSAIDEIGAQSERDLGKVMGSVMAKVKGKADGNRVREIVAQKLS